MVSQIFFVIGIGGAGKTTLSINLKNKLSNFHVHDFDEVGVPKNVDENWRHQTTNYWLSKTKEYYNKKQNMILCGFLVPSEAEKQANFDPDIKINYVFLQISPETIKKRLTRRGWDENKINYHTKWAETLEKEIENLKNVSVINGDKNTPEKIVKVFEDLINEQKYQSRS